MKNLERKISLRGRVFKREESDVPFLLQNFIQSNDSRQQNQLPTNAIPDFMKLYSSFICGKNLTHIIYLSSDIQKRILDVFTGNTGAINIPLTLFYALANDVCKTLYDIWWPRYKCYPQSTMPDIPSYLVDQKKHPPKSNQNV